MVVLLLVAAGWRLVLLSQCWIVCQSTAVVAVAHAVDAVASVVVALLGVERTLSLVERVEVESVWALLLAAPVAQVRPLVTNLFSHLPQTSHATIEPLPTDSRGRLSHVHTLL